MKEEPNKRSGALGFNRNCIKRSWTTATLQRRKRKRLKSSVFSYGEWWNLDNDTFIEKWNLARKASDTDRIPIVCVVCVGVLRAPLLIIDRIVEFSGVFLSRWWLYTKMAVMSICSNHYYVFPRKCVQPDTKTISYDSFCLSVIHLQLMQKNKDVCGC